MPRVTRFVSRYRWSLAAVGVALVAFVFVWFQPHLLFIDETVNEPVPVAEGDAPPETSSGPAEGSEPAPAPEEMTLLAGDFRRLEHATSGRAVVIELADGRRFLRFEDLETSNGPDLRVYLSEIPASDDWFAYGERYVDLGALKGNIGNQNYEIPDDVDLSRFESAVIWCRKFTVGFGVAPLDAS